ncbi:MAG: hypothetical protein WCJ67_04110 [Thermoleophilia bacterium]
MDALAAIDRALDDGEEADDVLRSVVAALAAAPTVTWAGILFLDDGTLTLGPESGEAGVASRVSVPVTYRGTVVGELAVDGDVEAAFLHHVAERIATHVLLGWDTGGERWEP